MRHQPIYDIAAICAKKGITNVVLCPGSRCAPLTLAFARHPDISCKTISDERSAGFIALGMAMSLQKPVAIICTSGSAVYNLAPAIAEAFFAHIPLVVLSADRPAEWIAQLDGQTIHQREIFGRHVKEFYQLPQDYEHDDSRWAINRIVNEAINVASRPQPGPVHINIPLREPLYPAADETIRFSEDIRIIHDQPSGKSLSGEAQSAIASAWNEYHHVLLVGGQHVLDSRLTEALRSVTEQHDLPIVGDIISNLHLLEGTIRHADLFLGQAPAAVKESLKPDLLITFGDAVISKNLKLFLRSCAPKAHWHVQEAGAPADPFKNTTHVFEAEPASFFEHLASIRRERSFETQKQRNYTQLWEVEDRRARRALEGALSGQALGEMELVKEVLQHIPEDSALHLANSMSVRYANFFGLGPTSVSVFSNRGTSGIDGCTSTAVGFALASGKPTFLITGDLAFFYDRNAFWHNYPLPNLRIVLLNNHGGIIFNIIDGPSSLPESSEYFVTRQPLGAKSLCHEFGFDHIVLDHRRKLKNVMKDFMEPDGRTKVLELETGITLNKSIFEHLKLQIKNSYES